MTNRAEPAGIHVGDVGTTLLCSFVDDTPAAAAFDISLATTKEIIFERPDGTAFARAGTFETDGTDGVLLYNLATGDIQVDGYWYLQGHVVFASGDELHTNRIRFRVRKNNATPAP